MSLRIRKMLPVREESRTEAGRAAGKTSAKVAPLSVVTNPYTGRALSADLTNSTDGLRERGRLLGNAALDAPDGVAQSCGKAALAGLGREIEHAVATETGEFGDGVRATVGGSQWFCSVSKQVAPVARWDGRALCRWWT